MYSKHGNCHHFPGRGKRHTWDGMPIRRDENRAVRVSKDASYFYLYFSIFLTEDLNRKEAHTKIRRSFMSSSNSSLSIDDVRREITKHISKLNPGFLCQPSEKVCVPGPPGRKGSRGSRGRRGPQGDKGKKGAQGIMGPPGKHGKQGVKGSEGVKGKKGDKGIQSNIIFCRKKLQ